MVGSLGFYARCSYETIARNSHVKHCSSHALELLSGKAGKAFGA